jgi:hypothetical protein
MIDVLLTATWVPGQGCAIINTDSKLLVATLMGYKLFSPAAGHSRLIILIFNDGLVYFVIV